MTARIIAIPFPDPHAELLDLVEAQSRVITELTDMAAARDMIMAEQVAAIAAAYTALELASTTMTEMLAYSQEPEEPEPLYMRVQRTFARERAGTAMKKTAEALALIGGRK